ncbi:MULTISPECIES: exosporium leader peptide-containing protein [Bacillus cereus group]|uniref:exosporium leader peptide-containing protein n=1 Tax=Bacillus cereus group TaxID=86661 RepID=UPI0023EE90E1|nr:exosporium leader peptide-containing protein [Bacillus cereus]
MISTSILRRYVHKRKTCFLRGAAFDSNLLGPTLSPIPPFTLPTGPTGPTGVTPVFGIRNAQY